jgi:predicted esterase
MAIRTRSQSLYKHASALLLMLICTHAQATPPADTALAYSGVFPSTTSTLTSTTLSNIRIPPDATPESRTRDMLVYRPSGVSAPSLLIFFSGTGSSLGDNLATQIGYGALRDFADEVGVVLVFPLPLEQGRPDWDNHPFDGLYWQTALVGTEPNPTWNAPVSSNADTNSDLLLTRAIIKEAIRAYNVDPNKVFLNGFSSGAFFSYFAAAVLNERITAFAASGGGMVLSNTTGGSPTSCTSVPFAGSAGEVRECLAAGWTPGTCSTSGAIPRPIAPSAVTRVPPAYLEANDNDDSVPYPHTCNLSAALAALPGGGPARVTRITHSGAGHSINEGYVRASWDFMIAQVGSSNPDLVFMNGFEP